MAGSQGRVVSEQVILVYDGHSLALVEGDIETAQRIEEITGAGTQLMPVQSFAEFLSWADKHTRFKVPPQPEAD